MIVKLPFANCRSLRENWDEEKHQDICEKMPKTASLEVDRKKRTLYIKTKRFLKNPKKPIMIMIMIM